jgi:xylose isomerase
MKPLQYAVGTWVFGSLGDRFVPSGYHCKRRLEERLNLAATITNMKGIELVYPGDVGAGQTERVLGLVKQRGLIPAHLCVDLYADKKWRFGSITADDEGTRAAAIGLIRESASTAMELGCPQINLWFGQDGHDYPFQRDYVRCYSLLVDSLAFLAAEFPAVQFCLEYKQREPRTHSLVPTVYASLAAVEEAGLPNIGVTLDVGHSLAAGENMAEAASLLLHKNRLFHLHLNDNYRSRDDDLAVGSIHTVEFVELLYWLDRLGYEGWYSLDIYPYREDPVQACSFSIAFLDRARLIVEKLNQSDISPLLRQDGALAALLAVNETIFDS